jgi:hypothetical protein
LDSRTFTVDSLTSFWSGGWHALFRRAFKVTAFDPVRRWTPFGYPGGILAAFLVSGLMHEFGERKLKTTFPFSSLFF